MQFFCFLNTKFTEVCDAQISIFDLGFLRGYGVFDIGVGKNNNIFLLEEHLARFKKSADLLSLKFPYSQKKIGQITKELLAKNNTKGKFLIRWMLTGSGTFIVVLEDYKNYPKNYYQKGVKMMTVNVRREIPEAKSLNYQVVYSLHQKMKKLGAFELLYTPSNEILEAATSNFFLVKDGQLITSKDDILSGVTRMVIMNLAHQNKISVIERKIKTSELKDCDEAFITATNKMVMPVTKVDSLTIGTGRPGLLTQKIMQLFEQYEEKILNKK